MSFFRLEEIFYETLTLGGLRWGNYLGGVRRGGGAQFLLITPGRRRRHGCKKVGYRVRFKKEEKTFFEYVSCNEMRFPQLKRGK